MNHTKFKRTQLLSLVLLLFPLLTISSSQAYNFLGDSSNTFGANDIVAFTEDFTTTTYENPVSDAAGWGSGALTNERDFTTQMLDFYATPSPVSSLDVQGRKVYYTCYNTSTSDYAINALDINDPSNMIFASMRSSLVGTMTVAVDGDTLYTGLDPAEGLQNFNSYNVSNAYTLGAAGVYLDWLIWNGGITDIEIEGNFAYFAAYNSPTDLSLGIADITDPDNLLGVYHDWLTNMALGLDVDGHLAYVAASTDGLYILNISSSLHPVEIGYINTPGNATDVLVDGRFAYVVDGTVGVHVVDISDPTSPTLVGSYDTPGNARKIVKQGNTLFVADGAGGVQVLDVADPLNPVLVTEFNLPYTWDLDLYGENLIIGTDDGIYSYKIGDIVDLSTSWYANPYDDYDVFDVRVNDGIAFIAGGIDEFIVVNVKNPSQPIELFRSSLGGVNFKKLDVNDQFAFLVDSMGIFIFDISDLSDIRFVSYTFGIGLTDACVQGKFVYVSFLSGFAILNYTSAYTTNWFAVHNLGLTNVTAIDVQGYHVYLTEWIGGSALSIHCIDIIDPLVPFITHSRIRYAYNYDIQIDGDWLYLAGTLAGNGMWLYNITDPYHFTLNDNELNNSYGIWSFGQYLLSANYDQGVALVDVSDQDLLVTQSSYAEATGALQITTDGDFTYVANSSSLVVLQHFASAGAAFTSGTTTAQSLTVSAAGIFDIIDKATLQAIDFNPPGTTLTYYMTADGVNWELVAPGTEHIFVNPGKDLRWKVEITGPAEMSAHVYEISIDYNLAFNPMWYYIFGGAGGGLLLIIILIVVFASIKKKKKVATR